MTNSKDKIIEEYLKFKSANVTTQNKIDNYNRFLKLFLVESTKPLDKYEESELVNCISAASKRYNTRTVNEIKTLLKNFIVWYFPDYPQRFRNMNTLLRHLKVVPRYTSRDMLSKEEVERLIQNEESFMWRAYWLVFFYGGMRPSEAAALQWKQITFTNEGCFVDIQVKKNQKKFTKFLPENVSFYLKQLKERSTSELCFPSRVKQNNQDVAMQRSGIEKRLRRLSLRVLGRKINPYQLRHSIATILYNQEGVDKDFVAQQMGHTKNMEQTYSHLSRDRIQDKLKTLYIKPELTPQKKVALETEVSELKQQIKDILHHQSNAEKLLTSLIPLLEQNKNVPLGQVRIKLKKNNFTA